MIKQLITSTLLSIAVCSLYAQTSRSQNLNKLIAAETNFAALAQETSFAGAFIQNLDSAGIIFRGAEPVNGRSLFGSQPDKNELLFKWYPVEAELSAGEDMGFTTGPYILILNSSKDTLGAGNYFSIWRKNAAGAFKVLLDGGINHTNKHEAAGYGTIPSAVAANTGILPSGIKNDNDFTATGKKFAALASTNLLQAYETYMANQCYLLRADFTTGTNKTGNLQTLKKFPLAACSFNSKGSFYSGNRSWCFTYGTVSEPGKPATATGYFVHIWQYQNTGWQLVADVLQLTGNN